MKDGFAGILAVAFYVAGFVGWLTSVISDASHSRIGWVIADILVFPMGVVNFLFNYIEKDIDKKNSS